MSKAELIRQLYRQSLLAFISCAFNIIYGDSRFQSHWTIEVIARSLQKFDEDPRRYFILNMPPRYLKSLADSKTKCNAHEFCGGLVVEPFSGSIVEFLGDGIQVKLSECGEVGTFGEVLSDESVEVFV